MRFLRKGPILFGAIWAFRANAPHTLIIVGKTDNLELFKKKTEQ